MSRNGDIPSTSEYTGVLYVNKGIHGKWKATIKHQGRKIVLGIFDKEEDAARAFDRAAVKFRGAGARTNFPILDYSSELAAWTPDAKDSLPLQQQPSKRARTANGEDRHPPLPAPTVLDQPPLIASASFKPKAPVTDVRPTPINARGMNPALAAVQSAITSVMQEPLEKFMGDPASAVNQRQQRALDWCRSQITAAQQQASGEDGAGDKAAEQMQLEQQHEQHQPSTPSQQSPAKQLGGPVVATLRVGADGQRKYRGVSWVAEKGKFRAQLSGIPGQKKMHLGYFATAEEAAAAYDAAAFTALGNAAHLNFRPTSTLMMHASPGANFTMGVAHPMGPRPRGRPRKNPELQQGTPGMPHAAQQQQQQQEAQQQAQQQVQQQQVEQQLLLPKEGLAAPVVLKKSKYLGVTQMKSGAFLATMKDKSGNKVRLGMYFTEEEAARAYDNAVLAARGPGTKTNFNDYGDAAKAKPAAPARTATPRARKGTAAAAAAASMGAADMAGMQHSIQTNNFSNGYAASLPMMQAHASQPLLHPQQHHAPQQLQHQLPQAVAQHNPLQPQPVVYMPHGGQQPQVAPATSHNAAQVAVGVAMPGAHMHSPAAVAPTYAYSAPVATAASAFTPLDGAVNAVFGYSAEAPVAAATAAASHAQYAAAPLAYTGSSFAPAAQPMQQQFAAARAASGGAFSGQWPYWGRT